MYVVGAIVVIEMMEVKSKVDREVDGNVSGCADMEVI